MDRLARLLAVASLLITGIVHAGAPGPADFKLDLRDGWAIRSSSEVTADGAALSTPGVDTEGWHRARVPTTVVAALVADGTYPDPFVGLNLRQIPGATYPVGDNLSNLPAPAGSPFAVPWWFRTEFTLPGDAGAGGADASATGRTLWLRLGGVNYRFDLWLNGRRIAEAAATGGAFRIHEFDVTAVARPGANALALAVAPPGPDDLAITFVDWNPLPPDRDMGLFRGVTLTSSGPVALRHPYVVATLNAPRYDRAELTVRVIARNATHAAVRGTLRGRIGAAAFAVPVALAADETREIAVSPQDAPALVFRSPKLWWPARYGTPALHDLDLAFELQGAAPDATRVVSDRVATHFGIREISAARDAAGHLVFRVNGRPMLIRGAGYTPDIMLRDDARQREAAIRYAKDLGLDALRLEGKLEDDAFFDLADRAGLLVIAGWCCCDHWEKWERWDDEDRRVAALSLRDQLLRLRGHASFAAWLNGSDGPPPAAVERASLRVLDEVGFAAPVLSSAADKGSEVTGPSGVKMRGPYEWVPPVYWYTDTTRGGAHGFATEVGPGPAPPPLESLRRFIPPDRLWPKNEVWTFHAGGGEFASLDVFDRALDARYGPSHGVEEYARKAQVAAYESHRAMFEAYGARKYAATGVIQWMLNSAWPSMIWHLYDASLRPGGAYFGAKKALEPLHVQYGYDDRSVVVVNGTLAAARRLTVSAEVYDLASRRRFRRAETVDVAADGVTTAFRLPEIADAGPTFFVDLRLADARGRVVSRNTYWLSATPDVPDWEASKWHYTPVRAYADFTGLERLPPATLTARVRLEPAGAGTSGRARVELANASASIAFFVHLAVRRGTDGEEILPVTWEDNDVTLLPGERRILMATYALGDAGTSKPDVTVDGWNVVPILAEPRLGR